MIDLIVIPARKNSKRLKNKNILMLGHKKLIEWTIDHAKQIFPINNIVVSSDSDEILNLSLTKGIVNSWVRPKKLSTSKASSADVCIHVSTQYEKKCSTEVKNIILLQPTSPFRNIYSTKKGVKLFKANPNVSVVAMTKSKEHPFWCFKNSTNRKSKTVEPYMNHSFLSKPSQDLPPSFFPTGSFFMISKDQLLKYKSFYTPKILPLLINDRSETIDIDTFDDFEFAKRCLIKLKKEKL